MNFSITGSITGVTAQSAPQVVLGMLALAICTEAGIEPRQLRARLLKLGEQVTSDQQPIQAALDQQMAMLLAFLPE